MDELKKWLENNQDAREYYRTETDSLWEGIERGLNKSQVRPLYWRTWVRWAAAVVLLMVFAFLLLPGYDKGKDGYALYELSPELADTEYYYAQQLGEKMATIKASGADIDPQLFDDLDQLDQIYKDLMMDLKDGADNEEVVQAMIQNYRIRLQMLERILEQIEEHETNDRDEASI